MKTGTVKLINGEDAVVDAALYKSSEQYKKIIANWKMIYGDKIIIQFAPDPGPTDFIVPIKKTKRLGNAHKLPVGGAIKPVSLPKPSGRTQYF